MALARVLYLNANHGFVAMENLLRVASEDFQADIVAITEPYASRGRISAPGWTVYHQGNAAVLTRPHLRALQVPLKSSNSVCLCLQDFALVVGYISPNRDAGPWFLDLESDLQSVAGPILLVGDFNARTSLVPGIITDLRGEYLEDLVTSSSLDFWPPNAPTRADHQSEGYNDCVITRGLHLHHAAVRPDIYSHSDHRFIYMEFASSIPPAPPHQKLDKKALTRIFSNILLPQPTDLTTEEAVEQYVVELTTSIQEAVTAATITVPDRRQLISWWTPKLELLKKSASRCARLERQSQDPLRKEILREMRIALTKMYRAEIKEAKLAAWRKFISPRRAWGKPYHVLKAISQKSRMPALKHPDGSRSTSIADNVRLLLESKFAADPNYHPQPLPPHQGTFGPPPRVTSEEVAAILRTLDNRKAPGPDGVNHGTLKLLHRHHPHILPHLYTACLALGYFPRSWCAGRVVFVPKPGKDATLPESYRPITLLSTIGKVFERVLNTTLLEHLETSNALHPAQFGFRPGRSTEDAVHSAMEKIADCRAKYNYTVLLSCDIKGAFDNARWDSILLSPVLKRIPQYTWRIISSYLSDRRVTCEGQTCNLTRGCPQGSVLGPLLWNAVHDSAIRYMERLVHGVVVYADDTLLIVGGQTRSEVEGRCAAALRQFSEQLAQNGLELNQTKTEVLVYTDFPRCLLAEDPTTMPGWDYGMPQIPVEGGVLEPQPVMKYLGVYLDRGNNWGHHIREMVNRAKRILPLLCQLCQNVCGYSNAARTVMVQGAVYTYLSYCSSLFYHRLWVRANRKLVLGLQRLCDRIRIRGYRTISGDAASVIALSPPLDLLIARRSIKYLLKTGREVAEYGSFPDTVNVDTTPKEWIAIIDAVWEHRWQLSVSGAWTRQIFPTIRCRRRTQLTPDFWATQALSGHGVFAAYLFEFRRKDTPRCPCGHPEETAEHVFWNCPIHADGRPAQFHRPLRPAELGYMQRVVIALWRTENPGHRLRVPAGLEDAGDANG